MSLNLFSETIIVTAVMAFLCALPLVSEKVRARSGIFVLIGTGAMVGICFFDLIPDIFEMGGVNGLALTAAIWVAYSTLHVFHLDSHHAQVQEGAVVTPSPFFFGAIIGHCFASGMLLVISQRFPQSVESSVYGALLIHKGYEALTVSSILVGTGRSKLGKVAVVAIYSLAFPAGAALTAAFGSVFNTSVAMWISSVAVGTLLGCLVFDFVIPSFYQLKQRRSHLAWIVFGLVTTQLVMRTFAGHGP